MSTQQTVAKGANGTNGTGANGTGNSANVAQSTVTFVCGKIGYTAKITWDVSTEQLRAIALPEIVRQLQVVARKNKLATSSVHNASEFVASRRDLTSRFITLQTLAERARSGDSAAKAELMSWLGLA